MKTFIKILLAILFIALIMTISFREKKLNWKGTMEEEYGISVAMNPKDPIYRDRVFSLKEDLALGEEERDEKTMFYLLTDIDADSQGNIYVIDSENAHIKVYDKKGRYLRVISRKGERRGELKNPVDIYIDDKDHIYVCDSGNNRLAVFSNEGDLINSIDFNEYSAGKIIGITPQGGIILRVDKTSLDSDLSFITRVYYINMYSSRYKFMKNLYSVSMPIMQHFRKEEKGIALTIPFQKELCWTLDPAGRVYIGDSQSYEIHVYAPDGREIRRIEKEYEPRKVSTTDVENYVKEQFKFHTKQERIFWTPIVRRQLRVPDLKPVFEKLFFADDKLFILRSEKGSKERSILDVFDSEGRYSWRMRLKIRPMTWKNDRIYSVEKGADGYHILKRYKVFWQL